MPSYRNHFWKKTPFLKLFLALTAGIILQWQLQLGNNFWWLLVGINSFLLIAFFFLPLFKKFRFRFISGLLIMGILLSIGALLTYYKDIRNNSNWIGNHYNPKDKLVLTIAEPPVEKIKSYKADAVTTAVIHGDSIIPVTGKIILYFQKDSSVEQLSYGSQIILKKSLQEIKNSGNPGGFDYKRYSLFQGITHQVFLKDDDYEILPGKKEQWLYKLIYASKEKILTVLRNNIKGEKEVGLAEALLIGYKNDLEQSLVQSYTNTGVVHIIAISGLHLGLIYWLLVILFKPLQRFRKMKWLGPLLIIIGLWSFSLLAGAQPSVLRSALMFTCIILGELFSRKTSIYNTMALSAFILLCYNPYWLWDVGFQLSYAAVLSIIIFMKPVYNLFYIKNKLLDFIWKLNAVTIAAQILTVPLGIYHFHQFPNYFLLTNFLAVPLSSIILLGEILLCAVAFIPLVGLWIGKLLSWLIWLMNTYVERIEMIPYSLLDGLQITITQAMLLIVVAAFVAYWLMEKSRPAFKIALASLLLFAGLRLYSFINVYSQRKIIVYNVPQKTAIDFVNGADYTFIGDSSLRQDGFARNFHLKPSRILYRLHETSFINNFQQNGNYISYVDKRILLLNQHTIFKPSTDKPTIDVLIISQNPKLYINKLVASFHIKQIVADGSVPAWKARYWKKDCDSLHIPFHDVTTKGAFEIKL
jgi:competence protein ComEC